MRTNSYCPTVSVAALLVCLALNAAPAQAEDRLGGHFGFVLPLVTRGNGQTTTIGDDFVIGFPMGITVRKTADVAFDLELVPVVQNDPRHIDLTVHPGVICSMANGFAVGGRLAFDIGRESWGFTPLLNKRLLQLGADTTLFGEIDVPIRFKEDGRGRNYTSVGVAVHVGLGF